MEITPPLALYAALDIRRHQPEPNPEYIQIEKWVTMYNDAYIYIVSVYTHINIQYKAK